jgi:hypothetical protein
MIVVQLKGGLGNQLFQYAAGLALRQMHNCELRIDTSFYTTTQERKFDLDYLNIDYAVADAAVLRKFELPIYRKVWNRIAPMPFKRVYREASFAFDPKFNALQPPIYLKGYWQSAKYFQPYTPVIAKAFTVRQAYIQHLAALISDMSQHKSVAVHIRRGDYLRPEFVHIHGVLDTAYYKRAIQTMQQRYGNCTFYFFSDDIDWVQQNLPLNDMSYVFVSGHITHNAIEDFYAMQHCQHNIIANSSFAWWAAWLNRHEHKHVIAPMQWFAPQNNQSTQDLIPTSWERV